MATNINQELFKRYAPKKKLGLINGLGQSELLATAPETIKRIAKETGRSIGKSRNKVLRISNDRRSGNNWNSDIEAVEFINGNMYLNIYFQTRRCPTPYVLPYGDRRIRSRGRRRNGTDPRRHGGNGRVPSRE